MFNNSLFKWLINDILGFESNDDKPVIPEKPVIDYTGNECFENRIYDDLCQDILEWLPIDDKIKLRAVSLQFYICLNNVLKGRRVLKVDKDVTDADNLVLGRVRMDVRSRPLLGLYAADQLLQSLKTVDMKPLDNYLRICSNTAGFQCGKYTYIDDKNQVLQSVIRNCSNLESFRFDFRECPRQLIERFGKKFGRRLKSLELCQSVYEVPPSVRPLLLMCPNLKSLVNINFDFMFDKNDNICITNLTRFKSDNISNKRQFQVFVKHNPHLTRLMVGFTLTFPSDMSDSLFEISKLTSLIFLHIRFVDFNFYDRHLAQSFQSIARNCVRLKNFVLEIESVQTFDLSHFIQSFKRLYSLRRLRIQIRSDTQLKSGFLDVKHIKNCRELTHLDLMFDNIDDEFFQGIHVLFPNLRNIKVCRLTLLNYVF